jgi:cytochrome c5
MFRSIPIAVVLIAALAPTVVAAEPPSVSAGGVTLSSQTVGWPARDQPFPAGSGVDVVNINCTACHSPAMVLTQPRLTQAEWQAEVTKMQKTYKARIDETAMPAIVAYLTQLQAKR